MTQSITYDKFINEEVYNWACKVGGLAVAYIKNSEKQKNDLKTQINNLLEIFKGDPEEATMVLMLYIARQSARNEIPRNVAQQLVSDIYQIFNSFKNNKTELEEAIRKYLVLFKWVFESGISDQNQDFHKFINNFIGRGRGR
jgi:hypothetical protein